jgi:hypothetical protein
MLCWRKEQNIDGIFLLYVSILHAPEISIWKIINRREHNICFINICQIIGPYFILQYLTNAGLFATIGSAHTSICLSECNDQWGYSSAEYIGSSSMYNDLTCHIVALFHLPSISSLDLPAHSRETERDRESRWINATHPFMPRRPSLKLPLQTWKLKEPVCLYKSNVVIFRMGYNNEPSNNYLMRWYICVQCAVGRHQRSVIITYPSTRSRTVVLI